MRSGRWILALGVAAVVFLPSAWADGDPASDVLYTNDLFVTYSNHSPDLAQKLGDAVAAANRSGYRLKVAVVATQQDLGIVTALYRKPQKYAEFLGSEIQFFYHGRLLVVMPNGFGVYNGHHPIGGSLKVLRAVRVEGGDAPALLRAVTAATKTLAAKDKSLPRFKDVYPPNAFAQPFQGAAKPGADVKFVFAVYDDSLHSKAVVRVLGQGAASLATLPVASDSASGVPVTVTWSVPASLAPQTLRFCARATDAAGNRAKPSCAPLKIA